MGTPIDDYTSNVIEAQLLYLDSADPGKDISIYFNTPGGSVYAGLGIYDTMQFISSDISTICTGMAASMGAVLLVAGTKGKRFALKSFPGYDTSTDGRRTRSSFGYRDYGKGDTET